MTLLQNKKKNRTRIVGFLSSSTMMLNMGAPYKKIERKRDRERERTAAAKKRNKRQLRCKTIKTNHHKKCETEMLIPIDNFLFFPFRLHFRFSFMKKGAYTKYLIQFIFFSLSLTHSLSCSSPHTQFFLCV
jgi:hypothetical protein